LGNAANAYSMPLPKDPAPLDIGGIVVLVGTVFSVVGSIAGAIISVFGMEKENRQFREINDTL